MTKTSELQPLVPLSVNACEDIGSLLDHMADASFGARNLGLAWRVLRDDICERDCAVVLTVSGAMTVAKLGPILGQLISRGIVDVVVTTGAIVTHSLVEETGLVHYKCPEGVGDDELYRSHLNRVFDSIEPEENLEKIEIAVFEALSTIPNGSHVGSHELIQRISAHLLSQSKTEGLLSCVVKSHARLYVPALADSELGLYLWRFLNSHAGAPPNRFFYDPLADVSDYAQWLRSQKEVAFLTIGGGVPRNWAQQLLPFLKSMNGSVQNATGPKLPEIVAAIRICPDDERLGHLSGCTYSEGISWGKFSDAMKGSFVEVASDATICLPILAKALFTHMDSRLIKKTRRV